MLRIKQVSIFLGLCLASAASAKTYSEGEERFEFSYTYQIPALTKGDAVELWLPEAHSDAFQTVESSVSAPDLTLDRTTEPQFGNHLIHAKADAASAGKTIVVNYKVVRKEKAAYPAGAEARDPVNLRAEPLMPLNDRFKKLALEITKGKTDDLAKGRAIYDYVFKEMKYDKSGTGWGRGDATYACDVKTGNCTDFHALFIVLARSVGIPARFAIGFSLPTATPQGTVEGYHCWAEFAAGGRWVPIDISEGWKDQSAKDYYFGHHPANRFELSKGQQLTLTPAIHGDALTFLVHPYVEVNGKAVKGTKGVYTFKRVAPNAKT